MFLKHSLYERNAKGHAQRKDQREAAAKVASELRRQSQPDYIHDTETAVGNLELINRLPPAIATGRYYHRARWAARTTTIEVT